jgi:hypothetical protein
MERARTVDFASAAVDWLLASQPPFLIGELTALMVDAKVDIPGIQAESPAERENGVRSSLRLNRRGIEKLYRLGRGGANVLHSMPDDELKIELERLMKPSL